ncbi:MAG: hypothetical protein Pg6C_12570 [Treponemataceae bacterium]|nr:MAG: hypothetical protein Pg6C_12570 [Treponemataceae bacterium]
MVKKTLLLLAGLTLGTSAIFAQEAKNTIMFLGSMLDYERSLSPKIGIGVEATTDFFGMASVSVDGTKIDTQYVSLLPISVDAFARLYPWAGKFFAQLGLGIQFGKIYESLPGDSLDVFGFHAKLQAGWKLDIGKPDHWVFEARLGPGMSVGGVSSEGETLEKTSYFMFTFPVQLGFGLKF